MSISFLDYKPCLNHSVYNFFEESLYFDGISNLLGYRRIGALVLGQLDQGIIYQRVALTAVKIFLYICFPELILFSLIGKSICHCLKLQVLEGKNKASDLASGSWKLEEKHGKVDIRERKWLSNFHLGDYFRFLEQKCPKQIFFSYPWVYTFKGVNEWLSSDVIFSSTNVSCKEESLLAYKFIAVPIFVIGNHWTLLFIDREKRTVEYYDSKQNYGNHQEGVEILKETTKEFSKRDPGDQPYVFSAKIKKKLQPDSYQCGPWVLYFIEQRLENPEVDFNKLDIGEAQVMIAKYRLSVMEKLIEMEGKGDLMFCT